MPKEEMMNSKSFFHFHTLVHIQSKSLYYGSTLKLWKTGIINTKENTVTLVGLSFS